jgi:hypothetical protein
LPALAVHHTKKDRSCPTGDLLPVLNRGSSSIGFAV